MTDALLGMVLVALLWGVLPPSHGRRLELTGRTVLYALAVWAALAAIVVAATLALNAVVRSR